MKVLVTGGGGFLGTAICKKLLARGYDVSSFSRRIYPHLAALGIKSFQGNLASDLQLEEAVKGQDAVIHTAAKAGIWGDPDDYYKTNVLGTRNLLRLVAKSRVSRLVYTSSPSIVFAGKDISAADESVTIPAKHLASYPATKAIAEEEILGANSSCLFTVALRPHLIWGPGDPHILPRLKERARQGKLFVLGDGTNKVDITYVENAAHAHIDALEALAPRSPANGNAYFIGQEQEVELWSFIDQLLKSQKISWQRKNIPYSLAYTSGALCEKIFSTLRIFDRDPPMTRFAAFSLGKSHYFSHDAAKRELGYFPRITTTKALQKMSDAHSC